MRTLVLASILAVCGCSGKVVETATPDAASSDASEETVDDACLREADKLAYRLSGLNCTTTVRISEADSSVIAWSVDCGGYSSALVDEASARSALARYPKYTTIDSFEVLAKGSMATPWIFGQSPGDFGGEGAVDARTGKAVYYANLSWSSLGEVVFPTTSEPVPFVCTKTTDHGYRVVSIGTPPKTDARAMDALEKTPFLLGIKEAGHVPLFITLVYVPLDGTVGETGYVPKNEWVALIQSTLPTD